MTSSNPLTVFFNQPEDGLIDAFARFRVSNPSTIFESNFISTSHPDVWSEGISGTAFSGYTSGFAWVTLNTPALNNQRIVRQSRRYMIYQPGKSFLIFVTGTLAGATGVSSRIGIYDDNDGYYYQLKDGELSVVERTSISGSVIETKVVQSNWNKNKVDGSSEADGLTIDPTKRQIFFFEQEWLGVGTLRAGLVLQNRKIVYTHQFDHANQDDVVPYTNRASLPIRYELETDPTGTVQAATMYQICCSTISEGGYDVRGRLFTYAQPPADSTSVSTDQIGLIAFRVNPERPNISFYPVEVTITLSTTIADVLVRVYQFFAPVPDSVVTGTVTWNDVPSKESAMQYADGFSDGVTPSNGTFRVLYAGYLTDEVNVLKLNLRRNNFFGCDVNNNSDWLLVTAEETDISPADEILWCNMVWQEFE